MEFTSTCMRLECMYTALHPLSITPNYTHGLGVLSAHGHSSVRHTVWHILLVTRLTRTHTPVHRRHSQMDREPAREWTFLWRWKEGISGFVNLHAPAETTAELKLKLCAGATHSLKHTHSRAHIPQHCRRAERDEPASAVGSVIHNQSFRVAHV